MARTTQINRERLARGEDPVSFIRGAFVVLEGLDRTGKSTLARELIKQCAERGIKARLQSFPDRSIPTGQTIDRYLRKELELDDEHVHQMFSDNRWECCEAILRDLEKGIWVISDRYAFSGAAYSQAKGLSMESCIRPDIGLPRPDVVFYLTASPTALSARGGFGEERYEKVEFQSKVKAQFDLVAAKFKQIHGEERWIEYETEGTKPEELSSELYVTAFELLHRAQQADNLDIPPLWVPLGEETPARYRIEYEGQVA